MTNTDPQHHNKTNLNTWISAAGFVVTILLGSVALGRFQAATEAAQEGLTQQIEEMKTQRATDTARIDARAQSLEAAINTLNIRDAGRKAGGGAQPAECDPDDL